MHNKKYIKPMNETVTYAIFGNNSNITAAIIGAFGALLGAIIALLGVLVNAWITKKSESERRRSEEKRWYADHYLDRKIDSIINLHSSLMDWYFSIQFYGNYPPSTLKEFKDQVNPKSDAYLRSLANVSIYLDQAEYSKLTEVLGAFRQASRLFG
jgi:hypothetical protein